jgi:Na+-translocating ferredoxin:NAD+ oxidoreductase subunit C
MPRLTFRGGVHPPQRKSDTQNLAITDLPLPERLIWPLEDPSGNVFLPLVKKDDRIRFGQVVARTGDGYPLHASAAGVIAAIAPRPCPAGPDIRSIVLRVSGRPGHSDEPPAGPRPARPKEHGHEPFLESSPEELRNLIQEAGVTDAYGNSGPLARRLDPGRRAAIHTVVVNAMESEPGFASDHRLLLERTAEIVFGLRLTMRMSGGRRGIFAVPAESRGLLKPLRQAIRRLRSVSVLFLDSKYPSDSETALLGSLGSRTAVSGFKTPGTGIHVQSVSATLAAAEAVSNGLPQTRRVLTVAGDGIRNPRNLSVPLGAPISACVEACGGYASNAVLLIHGGPMAGIALPGDDAPVTTWTTGLTILDGRGRFSIRETVCIRCGRCSDCCPAGLAPFRIDALWRDGKKDMARDEGAAACIRCGSCSYICPAKRPLALTVQEVRASGAEA